MKYQNYRISDRLTLMFIGFFIWGGLFFIILKFFIQTENKSIEQLKIKIRESVKEIPALQSMKTRQVIKQCEFKPDCQTRVEKTPCMLKKDDRTEPETVNKQIINNEKKVNIQKNTSFEREKSSNINISLKDA